MEESYKRFLPDELLGKIKVKNGNLETIPLEDIETISKVLNKNGIHQNQKYSVKASPASIEVCNKIIVERREKKILVPKIFDQELIKEASLSWEPSFDECNSFRLYITLKEDKAKIDTTLCTEYFLTLFEDFSHPRSSSIETLLTLKVMQPALGPLMKDLLIKMSDPESLPDL